MILLGIGSNLESSFGNRFTNIDLSISHLKKNKLKVLSQSSYYETPSYPNKKNPKFINVVVSISSDISFVNLVSIIIYVEEKLERKRNIKNDPRTCDIDIIDFNNQVFKKKFKNLEFQVPHKSMISRNFVLYPLQEIQPYWKHPETNEDINNLIKKLDQKYKKSILTIKKP